MELNALLLVASLAFATGTSLVTLSHGGQLQGKTYTVYDTNQVTVFLGVRYAQPPTGDLRFKKPVEYESWMGNRTALVKGSMCPQVDAFGYSDKILGEEDCLFLDVVVPGEVNHSANKAVMVWIHGGGYTIGSGSGMTTTGISVPGDVITVSINYRLAALGFLSHGPGTGNYGLWDQRMALLWVHDNIAAFGGDPNKVTIFGESAGAGSVSAQTISEVNDVTIFQRAIHQSGTIFAPWSWNYSPQERQNVVCKILSEANCPYHNTTDVYDCLKEKTVDEIFEILDEAGVYSSYLSPHPDEDFFPVNVSTRSYELANRFDNIVGYNSREGRMSALSLSWEILTGFFDNYANGLTIAETKKMVGAVCAIMYSSLEIEDCMMSMNNIYGLFERGSKPVDRSNKFVVALGEILFEAESHRLLKSLEEGSSNSVYAYRLDRGLDTALTELEPEYVKIGADHGHDVFYVFNIAFLAAYKDTIVLEEFDGYQQLDESVWLDEYDPAIQALSNVMITYWTNFAKTGNPNSPVSIGFAWPEFDANGTMIRLHDELNVITESKAVMMRYAGVEKLDAELNEVKLDQPAILIYGDMICVAGSSMATVNLSLFAGLVLFKLFF